MKKSLRSAFLFFVLAITLGACTSNSCPNQDQLFLASDDYKPVPADSLKTYRSFINYLEQSYCIENETKLPVIFFDLKKRLIAPAPGKNIIPVSIEPPLCEGDFKFEFDKILEIVLDGNNLSIEGKRMSVDSIPQYVYYQYLSFGLIKGFSRKPQGNGIWIISELDRPMSDFNPLIDKVISGYLFTAERLGESLFDKKLCELSQKEMNHLQSLIQFHLSFKFSDEPKPLLSAD